MEYFSILYYLATRKLDFAAGAFLGQISLLFLLPKIILARSKNKNKTEDLIETKKLIFQGSIVISYFIFRKRFFSDLLLALNSDH